MFDPAASPAENLKNIFGESQTRPKPISFPPPMELRDAMPDPRDFLPPPPWEGPPFPRALAEYPVKRRIRVITGQYEGYEGRVERQLPEELQPKSLRYPRRYMVWLYSPYEVSGLSLFRNEFQVIG